MKKRNHGLRGITHALAALGTTLVVGSALAGVASADTAGRKAGRGFAAVTTGFLEIPGNVVMETRSHGAARGATIGFVKGLGGVVVRTLVGVYEIVTAPFAVPAGYRPILSPEYPWGYFDEGRSVADNRYPRTR